MKTRLLLLVIVFAALFSTIPVSHAQQTTLYIAYQPFEHGSMIWRSDTGEILVLYNNWRMDVYAQSAYENLPENPVPDQAPSTLAKPVSGFGRVWGNFETVRAGLGWGTTPEFGYQSYFTPEPYTTGGIAQYSIIIQNGPTFLIRQDNTWGLMDGQPRPIQSLPVSTMFSATVQPFEHGYMLYWGETGSIWVLNNNGTARLYESTLYGSWLDNPVTQTPPRGMIKPILGFGKVWGHRPAVRSALGWATGPEQGYQTTFLRTTSLSNVNSAIGFMISWPDGRQVTIRDNGTWNFSNS
jgi:hypothetical protein